MRDGRCFFNFGTPVKNLLIRLMLKSKTIGDIVEALRFFLRAVNFQIHGAITAFQRFLFIHFLKYCFNIIIIFVLF